MLPLLKTMNCSKREKPLSLRLISRLLETIRCNTVILEEWKVVRHSLTICAPNLETLSCSNQNSSMSNKQILAKTNSQKAPSLPCWFPVLLSFIIATSRTLPCSANIGRTYLTFITVCTQGLSVGKELFIMITKYLRQVHYSQAWDTSAKINQVEPTKHAHNESNVGIFASTTYVD